MKQTVTSELKKSITKVTGYIVQENTYSDPRKNGLAVGVKLCYAEYSQPIINQIVEDMESKGFKLAYVRLNKKYGIIDKSGNENNGIAVVLEKYYQEEKIPKTRSESDPNQGWGKRNGGGKRISVPIHLIY